MKNKPLYIFDLDGTLALINHRRGMLKDLNNSNRWNDFYEACDNDLPNKPIIKLYNTLKNNNENDILIFSGRSEVVREKTLKWLYNNLLSFTVLDQKTLLMRKEKDYTPDEILKGSWYDNLHTEDKERLVCVFDDRNKVVNMWRSKGITCLQVAEGNF